MKALVTGSSGFAGTYLREHLEAHGDEVAGLDRAEGTDLTDAAAVHRRLEEVRPEVVYHLGGIADVGASWEDPVGTFTANATGTLHLLEAARATGVRRVLVIGSAEVYGIVPEDRMPLTEADPLRPVSPYGVSKVAAEHLALQAWDGHGLETVRVRAFNHLGPGQSERFVAGAIAHRIARAEREGSDEIEVGNLTPRRDFTDVRDVARAYRLLMTRAPAGEVYNVCSGRDVAISDLAETLVGLADRPLRLAVDPALQRVVDLPVSRGDRSKIRADTGWEPTIPLEETLGDLLDVVRATVAAP
ncbi:GDP-mannose 4,6-dehydratase [Actinomarinicola tropica]|uniref:NAD-dependent epimerase/dehydratase family protein n=1 Tax=Actinomarinicola tropica TaxID=2789776 RepID=A0A5Q2RN33_9ACTN|nr:GDP-mannose 4,6-dehydratase [Actinomarinicola tropica]QGG95816.1 NAD-dependent epimerase/dehydratase family protein [Actinomarinicola tropica]